MKIPEYKPAFKEKYEKLLGNEIEEFLEKNKEKLPKTIRVNTIKITKEVLIERFEKKGWITKPLCYYDNGIIIEKRDSPVGHLYEHFLGYFYVQEAASMLPPIIMDLKENDKVLDLCAAPGSKTTQISMMMNNAGVIIANEPDLSRMIALRANVQRMGCENVICTRANGVRIENFKEKFDKILVDAPCTATGAIRKKWELIQQWNPTSSMKMSKLQKMLLNSAVKTLNEKGTLVYSTCTLEPEEDEMVVQYCIERLGMKIEKIKINGFKSREGITEWDGNEMDKTLKNTIRVYPQDNNTEGFYIAKMVKK